MNSRSPRKVHRAVIATSHVDGHREQLAKSALDQLVESINNPSERIRMGVDHRRDFPPIGRLENAELVEKDGHFYVEADYYYFEKVEAAPWNDKLVIESFELPFQFVEVETEQPTEMSVSVDPNNFKSRTEVTQFKREIELNSPFPTRVNLHGRKALVPDPEVIFTFTGSVFLYHMLKPVARKIGEAIVEGVSDAIADEAKKVTKHVSKAVKEVFF